MSRRLAELASIPVGKVPGIGPRKLDGLEALGIATVLDLVMHYPRRYLDRTSQARLGDLALGQEATVLVTVRRVRTVRTRNRRSLVQVDVSDGTGYLAVTFFNQPWRARQLQVGMGVVLFGELGRYRGRSQMTNPVVDLVGDRTGRIVPIYPQSEKAGLSTWELSGWVEAALRVAGEIDDPVPSTVVGRFGLVGRTSALAGIHNPASLGEVQTARKRLVFDELLRIQLVLARRKRELERTAVGLAHAHDGQLVGRFHARLPFSLTEAQRRAIDEIAADLAEPVPMHRLLQGDVGAGKTLVAVTALLMGVAAGHQGALMAPTEVLAEQHHAAIGALLGGLTVPDGASLFGERPVRVELITGRAGAGDRVRLGEDLATGAIDVAVGTHALIQEGVAFRSLGVAVVDEQHRFGVEQRDALRVKGEVTPDVLVMTATPIPRTAAMTVYGDLDVSILDELPPGRTPVATVWVRPPPAEGVLAPEGGPRPRSGATEADAWTRIREEVSAGHQAYVVCPLVEESEKLQVRSAEETHARLREGELAGLELGLLHGRVRPRERELVMEAFRSGRLDVLVSTTVIEVGVDVPNATVMVILDADRFGMAQLHQLRGRVGRAGSASWCYMVGAGATPESAERLAALERSTDGFELAEVDLDLRGEGTILGSRQTGRNDLRLASLRRDREWVGRARGVAFALVDGEGLEAHPALVEELEAVLGPDEEEEERRGSTAYLFKS